MAGKDTFVTYGNAAAWAGLIRSGTVSDIPSGWNSHEFEKQYPVSPIVVAQCVDASGNLSVMVRNVTVDGFDYRVLSNGSDVSGKEIQWLAYVEGTSSAVVLDQVNQIIGTSYDSIDDLIANRTDFAKVCSSQEAMELMFVYQPAIDAISASETAMDVLMGNATSWAALPSYSALETAIKASASGHYKRLYRKYSGDSDTSSIHSSSDMVNSPQLPVMLADSGFMKEMFSDSKDYNLVITNGVFLSSMCKVKASRDYWNSQYSKTMKDRTTIKNTLDTSGNFTATQSIGQKIDGVGSEWMNKNGAVYNAANPQGIHISSFDQFSSGISKYTADSCMVYAEYVMAAAYVNSDMYVWSLKESGGSPSKRLKVKTTNTAKTPVMAGGAAYGHVTLNNKPSGYIWYVRDVTTYIPK